MQVHGAGGIDEHAVLARFSVGSERTLEQDLAFGFRQLVDIAQRALSPAINDPTTAVQAIDVLHICFAACPRVTFSLAATATPTESSA